MSDSQYVPPQKKTTKGTQSLSVRHTESYQGPIPKPEDLLKYEQISPGFASRLISMAEKEQDNRISLQKKKLEEDIKLQKEDISIFRRGQNYALMSLVLLIALCAYGFYLGYAKESAIISCTVIIGCISAFLFKKNNLNKDS
ncbi:MAG: DUF2335 domain-containing protein [Flavobacteriaceae bacterium]|jgi:uncharacterized membrane protein|nr:DUF2335 domain-containing protein [Flavobacteriaceae bacterium]